MGHAIVSGGARATAPVTGILASDLAAGSSVYLMENGVAVEYLVVNQGIPSGSSLYDASCDGTWLLRKDCYESRQWHSSNVNNYGASTIHTYLNGTFFNLFSSIEKSTIKQIKIPYINGTGGSSLDSGSNGLSTKVFLLSGYEVGFSSSSYLSQDGAKLSYFSEGTTTEAKNKRKAYLSGNVAIWFTRSPNNEVKTRVFVVDTNGAYNGDYFPSNSYGIRPSLVLPSNALFDSKSLILKGVA